MAGVVGVQWEVPRWTGRQTAFLVEIAAVGTGSTGRGVNTGEAGGDTGFTGDVEWLGVGRVVTVGAGVGTLVVMERSLLTGETGGRDVFTTTTGIVALSTHIPIRSISVETSGTG